MTHILKIKNYLVAIMSQSIIITGSCSCHEDMNIANKWTFLKL